jgi:hypothetical protein
MQSLYTYWNEAMEKHRFVARHGWFNCFSDRANLHNVNVSGQADSADTVAARQFTLEKNTWSRLQCKQRKISACF